MLGCSKGQEILPESEFYPDPKHAGTRKFSRYCRSCIKVRDREAYQRNKARRDATNRAWRQANPERRLLHVRRSQKRNPDSHRRSTRNDIIRRKRLLAGAPFEPISYDEVYQAFEGRCGICKESLPRAKMTLDHIIPLSKGGAHTRANVQPAHRACNSRKGARLEVIVHR